MKYQIREDELSHEIVEYFTAKSELTKRNKRAIEHHIATVEELLENGRREDEVCHREKEEMLKKIEELLKNDVELMKEENGLHQGKIKKLIKDTDRTYFFLLVMNLIVIVFIFGLSWWHLKSDRDRAQQANAAETERRLLLTLRSTGISLAYTFILFVIAILYQKTKPGLRFKEKGPD